MVRQFGDYGLVERTLVERGLRNMGWLAGSRSLPSRWVYFVSHVILKYQAKFALDWNVWSQFVVRNARGIWKIIDIDRLLRLKVSNKRPNSIRYAPLILSKFQ